MRLAITLSLLLTTAVASAQQINIWADHTAGGPPDSYRTGLAELPTLALQIGDFPHGNPWEPGVTVEAWRVVWRNALAESFQEPGAPLIPLIQVPDDHDYCYNNATKSCKGKLLALQAHDELLPTPPRPHPSMGLWHTVVLSDHLQVIVLDLRFQKDGVQKVEEPGHTMLGATQKQWFKDTLLASTATWKLVVSSLSFNPTVTKWEAWFGFPSERNELLSFIAGNGITGVIIASGDIHSGGGLDNGTFAGLPEISVPHSNMVQGNCTSPTCGQWSHGIDVPKNLPGGYSTVRVDVAGVLTAEIKDGVAGAVRRTMTLSPQ